MKYILLNCLFGGNVVPASRLQSQDSEVPDKDTAPSFWSLPELKYGISSTTTSLSTHC